MQDREPWPPDYVAIFAERQRRLMQLRADPALIVGAKEYYRDRPAEFIVDWCMTYDPRNALSGMPTRLPFWLFKRQRELVVFLVSLIKAQESGLVEKCRDMGATWLCCAFSVWLWLFWPDAAVGWGSRKEALVDKLGDPDSIFEKMRRLISGLPWFFLPAGFSDREHVAYMKLINPENGATITGEAGDNIGRGGRKLIYFKDESAHYERPELIEAALADNTNVQIDISSVNGIGNVFYRRRQAGVDWEPATEVTPGRTYVFVMDWRDHPAKTPHWYAMREQKARDNGLLHIHRQEVDRDYAASLDGVVIPPEWVRVALDAHIKHPQLGIKDEGPCAAALDVADEGLDRNALALRRSVVLRKADAWGDRDTGVTTRRAIGHCEGFGPLDLQYDCIGVGAGVKAEANRLKDEKLLPAGIELVKWNAGASPLFPGDRLIENDEQSPTNKNFFDNLKAQGWWMLRRRFEKTYRAIMEGLRYHPDELISISSEIPLVRKLCDELSQPTFGKSARSMKLLINKTPNGMASPNLGDATMMCYWPIVPDVVELFAGPRVFAP